MFGKKKVKEKPEIIDAENYKIKDVETDEKEESKEEIEMKKINKKGGIIGGIATLLVGAGVLAVTLLRKPEVIDCTRKDSDLDDDFDDVFEVSDSDTGTTE